MTPPCSKSALLEGLEVDQYMWSVVQVRRGHIQLLPYILSIFIISAFNETSRKFDNI